MIKQKMIDKLIEMGYQVDEFATQKSIKEMYDRVTGGAVMQVSPQEFFDKVNAPESEVKDPEIKNVEKEAESFHEEKTDLTEGIKAAAILLKKVDHHEQELKVLKMLVIGSFVTAAGFSIIVFFLTRKK